MTSWTVPHSALNEWQAKDSILEDLHTYGQDAFLLTGDGEAEALVGGIVSAGLFAALGVHPRLGRDFAPDDYQAGSEAVVLLSDTLWRKRFAVAADTLGRSLTINDCRYTIVGVMPPGFTFPVDSDRLWIPLIADRAGPTGSHALARLRPGVSLAHAQVVTETTTRNRVDHRDQALPEIRVGTFTRRGPETVTWTNSASTAVRYRSRHSAIVRWPESCTRYATSSSFRAIRRDENVPVAYAYNSTVTIICGSNGWLRRQSPRRAHRRPGVPAPPPCQR